MKKTDTKTVKRIDYWTVRRLMDSPHLSMSQFAALCGITKQYLNVLIRNKVTDIYGNLRRPEGFDLALAEYLGCNVSELYEAPATSARRPRATATATL
jgi:transcriptional regulator with XRE-family HTH domain